VRFFELFSQRNTEKITDVYIYDDIPEKFRNQIVHILREIMGDFYRSNEIWTLLRDSVLKEFGLLSLNGYTPQIEIEDFLLKGNTVEVLDLIDLLFSRLYSFVERTKNQYLETEQKKFMDRVIIALEEINYRFKQNDLGFQIIEGQLIKVDNQLIHNEIIKPAISLLHEKEFKTASDEFLEAHKHFREADYEEAIVDAERAFESTMKIICHKKRFPYKENYTAKKLISVLLDNNFIPQYLQTHFSQLCNTLENGLPTVRNKNGSHGQGVEEIDIPEYMSKYALNLCATNIVFLVDIYKHK
jgi:hypothetical protein